MQMNKPKTSKPCLWFSPDLKLWCCGLARDAGLFWAAHTPLEAFKARYKWLAKDD